MVVSTLADPTLRDKVLRMCELSHVPAVDLLGPTIDGLASFLGRDAAGVPMRGVGTSFRAPLGDAYYRRIKAVEFALKADDGKAPWVLSQTMGLRLANVPLVAECFLPRELLDEGAVDHRR